METETNQNYWLTIEPYVYINFTQSSVLLYNTLDAAYIESSNPLIIKLVQEVSEKKNCGVYLLTNQEFEKNEIQDFIFDIRQKFIGDILPTELSEERPVQLISLLNFQEDKKRLNLQPHISIGDNILSYLHEVKFDFDENNELNINTLCGVIEQLHNVSTINLGGDIWEYLQLARLLESLNKIMGKKNIVINYQDVDIDKIISTKLGEGYSLIINVDFPIDECQWDVIVPLLSSIWKTSFVFKIEKEEDLSDLKRVVNDYKIDQYQLLPIYNNENINFFRENVFLTKEDILSTPLSMREIFANQTLNTYNFGRLHIEGNGNVFAKGNKEPLGNINKDTIKKIIYNEISNGSSWLNVRESEPCTNCLYQWICPSPSNYEIEIDKPNLCHVKP